MSSLSDLFDPVARKRARIRRAVKKREAVPYVLCSVCQVRVDPTYAGDPPLCGDCRPQDYDDLNTLRDRR